MPDREETRDSIKQGMVFVNSEALHTWLRFGTPILPIDRPLAGAELLRWVGQRPRGQKLSRRERKE